MAIQNGENVNINGKRVRNEGKVLIQKRYKFGNEYKEILNLTSSNNYSIVINEKLDRGKVFVG